MNMLIETANRISRNTVELQVKLDRFNNTTRSTVWEIMAEVYALGLQSKVQANAYDFDALLQSRDLKPAKPHENEWLQIIRVCCGRFIPDDTTTVKWKPNAGMQKYARALRYMSDKGVTAIDALAYISDAEERVAKGAASNRRHLNGMIAADKIAHPAKKRDMTKPEFIAEAVKQAIASVPVPFKTTKKREYVRLFGYVENGVFTAIGQVPHSGAAAKLDVHRYGKTLKEAA